MLQVWAFDVFYFLNYTMSVGVFTLIKLVFETYATKLWQRGVMSRRKKYLGASAKTRLQFFFLSFCIFWERTYEARGNDIYVTKLLKPTNFNFPEWQTESSIPSKIVNEILICVL